MKAIATLMITLFVLQVSIATVPGRSGQAVCYKNCWRSYERCLSQAYDDYQRCRRFGEEMQCYFAYDLNRRICSREFRNCMTWCR